MGTCVDRDRGGRRFRALEAAERLAAEAEQDAALESATATLSVEEAAVMQTVLASARRAAPDPSAASLLKAREICVRENCCAE